MEPHERARVSIDAIKWAFDLVAVDPGPKFTLVALANRADEEGHVYPSVRWICKRTGYGDSTVRQHLRHLEEEGYLAKELRIRDDGGQTSNLYQLAMVQPGMRLNTPLSDSSTPPSESGTPPSRKRVGPPPESGGGLTSILGASGARKKPHTQDETKEEGAGQAKASPVAACFEAYRQGIMTRHGADYPPSASANGMLAQIVKKLGAEPALAVVQAYVTSQKPFYLTRKHALEILAKDAPTIWIEIQQRSGGAPPAADAKALVLLDYEARGQTTLAFVPAGDPEQIARNILREYGRKITTTNPKNIVVGIGTRRHVYSVAELRSTTSAPPQVTA